jgi:hypothetical protein
MKWAFLFGLGLAGTLAGVYANSSGGASGPFPARVSAAVGHSAEQIVETENEQAWLMLAAAAKEFDSVPMGVALSKWHSECEVFRFACPGFGGAIVRPSFMSAHTTRINAYFESANKQGRGAGAQDGSRQRGPVSYQSRDGDSIFFNDTAFKTTKACAENGRTGCASGVNFEPGSIVVRVAWMSIPRGASCPEVYTFDPANDTDTNGTSYPVLLDTGNCANPKNRKRKVLDDFFHVPISVGQMLPAGSDRLTSGNLDSFRTREGVKLQDGDTAVILGFHAMLRDKNTWHWATFWWSSDPKAGPSQLKGYPCALKVGCPFNPNAPNEWDHYVVATVSDPVSSTGTYTPITNPYLEPMRAASENCIICHTFAMLPRATNAGAHNSGQCGSQTPASMTLQALNDAADTYQNTWNPKRLETSQVWVLAEDLNSASIGSSATSGGPQVCPPPR